MPDLAEARAFLRDRFGFPDFLPGQVEALEAALNGQDIFFLAPTGSGKSLIYQLPSFLRPGLTLVVSPLVALTRTDMERVNAMILSRTGSDVTMIPEVANHLISSGGKRLRPILTLACAGLCQYRGEGHVKLAAAVTTFLYRPLYDLRPGCNFNNISCLREIAPMST